MVASVCAAAAGANQVWQTRSVAKATALETIDRKRIGPRSMRFEPSRNRCMVRMPTLPDVLAHTSHEKCQPAYINRANLRELIEMASYGAPEIRRRVCAGGAFCRRPGGGRPLHTHLRVRDPRHERRRTREPENLRTRTPNAERRTPNAISRARL